MSVYRFSFPLKTIVNCKDRNPNNIKNYINNKYGLDLVKYIREDFIKNGERYLYEEIEANFKEYFSAWMELIFDDSFEKLYSFFDMDYILPFLYKDEFHILKEEFNSYKFEFPYKEYNRDFKINSYRLYGGIKNSDGNYTKAICNFITDRDLTEDELGDIKDYIIGELSEVFGISLMSTMLDDIEEYGCKFIKYPLVYNQGIDSNGDDYDFVIHTT